MVGDPSQKLVSEWAGSTNGLLIPECYFELWLSSFSICPFLGGVVIW